jgi:hypothetical protein
MPISHFDAAMLAETSTTWTSHQRICGQVLGTRNDAIDAGYAFLVERLFAFTQDGTLEFRDESDTPYPSWQVRRPPDQRGKA